MLWKLVLAGTSPVNKAPQRNALGTKIKHMPQTLDFPQYYFLTPAYNL